jgi:eukaryotic-like serine/threonine-protein kinase
VDFHVGDLVGDYRVIGALGAGGMGTVYKVQHMISERVEALKVLLPDLEGNPHLAERFLREIKLQATLSHPNIAGLLNAFRLGNRLLMVIEYVEGQSLDAVMRTGRVDLWTGVALIEQVLSALAYAHSRHVIHRDIKPANIMLTPQGVVKLMDFGIARPTSDSNLTQPGTALGSVYYMSPEQVKGGHADERSDIYSVGVTLYELATGVRPLQGASSYSVMNAHLDQIPSSPDTVNSEIPSVLAAAILKALEKDPAARYRDAEQFRAVLEDARRRGGEGRYGSEPNQAFLATMPAPWHPVVEGNMRAEPTPQPASRTPAPNTPPTTPTGMNISQASRAGFDPDDLDRVKRQLAAFIGPVAKVLVDRTAKKAGSWRQLYELLAQEVPPGPERERFLASRRQ